MPASLIAALLLAAQPAAEPVDANPPPLPSAEARAERPAQPLKAEEAVDANGVPAWAKRKHQQPVQACETKPGIGIETWRQHYDNTAVERLKPRPPTATCR